MEKENMTHKLNTLSNAINEKCDSISAIVNDTIKYQSAADIENSNLMNESRTTYALSLYSKISNISWDYTSPSDRLSGCKY